MTTTRLIWKLRKFALRWSLQTKCVLNSLNKALWGGGCRSPKSMSLPKVYSNASISSHLATWWCHQMKIFSALLAFGEGNPQATSRFPSQRPLTQSFDVFFDMCLPKRLDNTRDAGDLRQHRAHYGVTVMTQMFCRTVLLIPMKSFSRCDHELKKPSHTLQLATTILTSQAMFTK